MSQDLRAEAERLIREVVAGLFPFRNDLPSARLSLRGILRLWRQNYRQQ